MTTELYHVINDESDDDIMWYILRGIATHLLRMFNRQVDRRVKFKMKIVYSINYCQPYFI